MAESLPARRALYKKTTDPDNAWVEAVGGEFQAEPGVEYEVCCVGPSEVATKTWTPQNLPIILSDVYTPPTELYDFSDFSNWTVTGKTSQASLSNDATYVKFGASSVNTNVIPDGTTTQQIGIKNSSLNFNMAGWSDLFVRAYVKQPLPANNLFLRMRLYSSTTAYAEILLHGNGSNSDVLEEGWNYWHSHAGDTGVTTSGGVDYSSIYKIEILVSAYPAYQAPAPLSITFDSIAIGGSRKPVVMLAWDDLEPGNYVIAQDLVAAGIKGTFYTISRRIDTPSNLTTAQVGEMYAMGHDLAVHGWADGYGGPDTSWVDDPAAAAIEIAECMDYFDTHGFTRAMYHCSYPEGKYNADVLNVIQSAGIKTGRVIVGHQYTVGPPVIYGTKSYKPGIQLPNGEIDNPYRLMAEYLDAPKTLAGVKALVEKECFQNGSSLMLFGHTQPFGNQAQAQEFYAWLASQRDLGKCYIMTISEFSDACGL